MNVTLPRCLQSIAFGTRLSHSLENVTLPSGLKNIILLPHRNLRMKNVTLPCALQNITFGIRFNQSLENVTFLSGF